jgi:predicted nuclease of predicted toxin-antitoxin system
MRILLDESLPKKLGYLLSNHHVRTAQHMGFAGYKKGRLMAAQVAYHALSTEYQKFWADITRD